MLENSPLLTFSLILLGLVTGPWVIWILYAKMVVAIQQRFFRSGRDI